MTSIDESSDVFRMVDAAISRMSHIACLYSSQFVWHIEGYSSALQRAKRGLAPVIFSRPFFSHRNGYRMAVSFAPFGDGDSLREQNSVFVSILSSDNDDILEWPFACPITFTMLDQSAKKSDLQHFSVRFAPKVVVANAPFLGRPVSSRNPAFGIQRYVPISEMREGGRFVKNDALFIDIQIDVRVLKEI
ncbi:hypothetical protein L596_007307 [Steinernema carpocapsae]|uniref:MATH domain-containing protein n=1 Tax=Steinernema carpocapsae TaxID=34508 RepID=A0A4U5P8Z6_STECR|nr:hypothetical protein L596_007307 [Steinernema carpocapsae]